MSIPAIIVLLLYTLNLLASARMHGRTAVVKINFWGTLVGLGLGAALLAWGGFFS